MLLWKWEWEEMGWFPRRMARAFLVCCVYPLTYILQVGFIWKILPRRLQRVVLAYKTICSFLFLEVRRLLIWRATDRSLATLQPSA